MTITVSTSAVSGSHTITITAASNGGGSKTATYILNIRTPILFYAQFQWHGSYYDVYTGVPGDQSYWYGANILSVDWIPYDPSDFSVYYPSSYGTYALAVWKDPGSTCQYEWYSMIYYDKSSYVSGIDERYPWSSTSGYVSSRSGSFTVPAGSGSNPVIIRARYTREVWIHVEYRPTDTEASPYDPGDIAHTSGSETPNPDWWKENVQFTALPGSGYSFGEWHKDRNWGTVYSTSRTIQPWEPMVLTADFYPLCTIYYKDYEDVGVSGTVTIDGEQTVSVPVSGYNIFLHPYTSHTFEAPPTNTIVGYTVDWIAWDSKSTYGSRVLSVNNIVKPQSHVGYYETPLRFRYVVGGFSDFLHTTLYAEGVVESATTNNPRSGVTVEVTWWRIVLGMPSPTYGSATTDSNGYFYCSVFSPVVDNVLIEIDFDMTNVPFGYQGSSTTYYPP